MAPLLIAHRGGAALAPENTLVAFANAVALGADGAELDVHLTRDGKLIVAHDFRLDFALTRDARGAWLDAPGPRLRDLTFAELALFDVGRPKPGSDYARSHPLLVPCDGERVPPLFDVIDLVRRAPKPFSLFIEVKSSLADPTLSASPRELAESTVAVLCRNDYLAQSVLIGFDWRALVHAKKLAPTLSCWFSTRPQSWFEDDPPPTDDPPPAPARMMLRQWAASGASPWAAGYDAIHHGGSIIQAIKAAGADGWFPYWRDATAENVSAAHALGLKVGAWTVDDPHDMRALTSLGIDAICTDRPDLMKQLEAG